MSYNNYGQYAMIGKQEYGVFKASIGIANSAIDAVNQRDSNFKVDTIPMKMSNLHFPGAYRRESELFKNAKKVIIAHIKSQAT